MPTRCDRRSDDGRGLRSRRRTSSGPRRCCSTRAGRAPARPGGAARGAGRPARLLALLARAAIGLTDRAVAGRGRRAGPARAGAVLGPRPRAAARRPQGRRAARRADVVPAVGRRGSGSTTPCAPPDRPSRSRRRTCAPRSGCWRPGTSPVDPELSDTVAVRRPAGLAGGDPRPLRRARRGRPRPLAQVRRRRPPRRARPEERPRRPARRPADRRAGRRPAASTARRATCSTAVTCCSTSARSCTASPGAPATCCAPRTPTRWRRAWRSATGSSWPGRCRGRRARSRSPPRWGCARPGTRCPAGGWPHCAARRCAARSTAGSSSTRARWRWPATPRPSATRRWCCGSPRPRPAPGCRWPRARCTTSPTPRPSCASRGRGRRWTSCCRCWAPGARSSTSSSRSTAPACGGGCSRSGARCATCRRATARTSGPSTGTWSRPARRRRA